MWRLLIIHINAPWFGHHDANGIWLSATSRNFRSQPLGEIGLVPIPTRAPIPPGSADTYVHHPPITPWLVTIGHILWGDHPMSARLTSIFSTMIALSAFFVMARRLYKTPHALMMTAFFALNPMIIYFGRMPNHEPLSLALILLLMASYINWMRTPQPNTPWMLYILATLAIWTAWASAFFVAILGFLGTLRGKSQQRPFMWGLTSVAIGAVVSVVAFYTLFVPETPEKLLNAFLWRTSTRSEISRSFTILDFIFQTAIHLIAYASITIFTLAIIGTPATLSKAHRHHQPVLWTLFLAGIAYIVIFRSASYVHDYYKIYMMPFMAVATVKSIMTLWHSEAYHRLTRPTITAICLVSAAFSALYLSNRYTVPFADATIQFATNIADNTHPDQVLLINLDTANPAIEYYAHRFMIWGVDWQDATIPVPNLTASRVYIYCTSDDALPPFLPAESTLINGCAFIQLTDTPDS